LGATFSSAFSVFLSDGAQSKAGRDPILPFRPPLICVSARPGLVASVARELARADAMVLLESLHARMD
jgi:hypothetical protein